MKGYLSSFFYKAMYVNCEDFALSCVKVQYMPKGWQHYMHIQVMHMYYKPTCISHSDQSLYMHQTVHANYMQMRVKRPSHGKLKLANLCWQTQVGVCERHKKSRHKKSRLYSRDYLRDTSQNGERNSR